MKAIKKDICPEGLSVGDLVKWNGDTSGRIDKVTDVVFGFGGGYEYYTEEINPQDNEKAKRGKQFFDRFNEHTNRGVGIVKL